MLNDLQKIGVPCNYVIGNHNSDDYPLTTVLKFFNLEKSYYSFVSGKIKFIVLDANYIKSSKGCRPYCNRNYNKTKDEYPLSQ